MNRSQLCMVAAALVPVLSGAAGCAPGNDGPVPCQVTGTCTNQIGECDTAASYGYQGLCVAQHLRKYVLHLPTTTPAGKWPLIVTLHGALGSAAVGQPIDPRAATDSGFAVVAPEGTWRTGTVGGTARIGNIWSAGGLWDTWTGGADDVGFIGALIDTLTILYPIDRARVFVTGYSNGSLLAYRLAHQLSARIAAIAALSGQELEGWSYPEPTDTVAVMHVHGLADSTIAYLGGSRDGIAYTSVPATLERWRRRNGCAGQPDTVLNASVQGVLGLRWRSGSGRGDVVLYTHPGGHGWGPGVGPDLILNFFKALPPRAR